MTHNNKTMATAKQKKAFKTKLQNPELNDGKVMLSAGFAKSTSRNPSKLTKSKGWQELLEQVDDDWLLKELKSIAKDTNDKRPKLQAIDMLLKLKDRYPAGKVNLKAEGSDQSKFWNNIKDITNSTN